MPHYGEALIAISKTPNPDGSDQFSVSFHFDGVEPWDVFRSAVALVCMVASHLRVTPGQVLEDIEEFIADGAVGTPYPDRRRDN